MNLLDPTPSIPTRDAFEAALADARAGMLVSDTGMPPSVAAALIDVALRPDLPELAKAARAAYAALA